MGRAWLGCLLAGASGFVMRAEDVTGNPATITVSVYDYARLSEDELSRFVSNTREILSRSGVSARLTVCKGASALTACEDWGHQPLIVRILPRLSKGAHPSHGDLMGVAFADHTGCGSTSVSFEAARTNAELSGRVGPIEVLSYAAVHEIGHVLLGPHAHTRRGLMKAEWNRSDLLAIAQNAFHFTNEQVRSLADRYGTRTVASFRPHDSRVP